MEYLAPFASCLKTLCGQKRLSTLYYSLILVLNTLLFSHHHPRPQQPPHRGGQPDLPALALLLRDATLEQRAEFRTTVALLRYAH